MQHLKHLIMVFTLGLLFVLLSSWPVVYAAPGSNLFVVPVPGNFVPACTQSDPCGLQSAVNRATTGVTIYIAGGTYTGTTDAVLTVTKSITLYGGWNGAPSGAIVRAPDHYKSIFNGQGQRRGVYINGDVAPTLDGLFITNGSRNDYGGGIYAEAAHPIISDCHIYSNTAYYGGGIYFSGSPTATLTGNQIYSNTASYGGGLYLQNSPATALTGNQVYSNSSGGGGGLYLAGSPATTIENNQIYGNIARYDGGGLYLDNSPASLLVSNTLRSNTAISYTGGGIELTHSPTTTLSHNQISDNTTEGEGGGIYIKASPAITLTTNEIYSNVSGDSGGGLSMNASALAVVIHNQIYSNTAFNSYSYGGGIYLSTSPTTTLAHNQVYQNQAHAGGGIYLQDKITGTTVADNEVYSNTANTGGGLDVFGGSSVTLTGNLIRSNRVISYEGGGLNLSQSENIILLNNVVLNNELANSTGCGSGIKFYEASASLWHTTVAGNTGGTGVAICLDRSPSSVALTNTIIASQTVGILATWHNTATLNSVLWYGNGLNFSGDGQINVTHAISGDPLFAADGYHLTVGSPAINAGVTSSVMTDIDNEARPAGCWFDLGADEFSAGVACRRVYLPLVLRH